MYDMTASGFQLGRGSCQVFSGCECLPKGRRLAPGWREDGRKMVKEGACEMAEEAPLAHRLRLVV